MELEPTELVRWYTTGLMRWYTTSAGVRTLQQQWGKRNNWAWYGIEWRDVPEVFE